MDKNLADIIKLVVVGIIIILIFASLSRCTIEDEREKTKQMAFKTIFEKCSYECFTKDCRTQCIDSYRELGK